jgi:hypothetical protein
MNQSAAHPKKQSNRSENITSGPADLEEQTWGVLKLLRDTASGLLDGARN